MKSYNLYGLAHKCFFTKKLTATLKEILNSLNRSAGFFLFASRRKFAFFLISLNLTSNVFSDEGFRRTQEIEIKKGWNAIYLEVDPSNLDPSSLLVETPIEVMATLHLRRSTSQYSSNPDANLLKKQGWTVWYADTREDSFLSDLSLVSGGRAYLVKSKENFIWRIEGRSSTWSKFRWKTNAFNFVGFSVKKNQGPTFDQFFGSSPSHKESDIYTLKDDKWVLIEEKTTETLRSGEAFWIFCKGASDYSGPLNVRTDSSLLGLIIGEKNGQIIIENQSDFPIGSKLKHFIPSGAIQPIGFSIRVLDGGDNPIETKRLPFPNSDWTLELPTIASEEALAIPFSTRPAEMINESHHSLFCVESDLGTLRWIRVTSMNERD